MYNCNYCSKKGDCPREGHPDLSCGYRYFLKDTEDLLYSSTDNKLDIKLI